METGERTVWGICWLFLQSKQANSVTSMQLTAFSGISLMCLLNSRIAKDHGVSSNPILYGHVP